MTQSRKIDVPYYLAQIPLGAGLLCALCLRRPTSDTDPFALLAIFGFGILQHLVASEMTTADPESTLPVRAPVGTAIGVAAIVATGNLAVVGVAYCSYYVIAAMMSLHAAVKGASAPGNEPAVNPAPGTAITREDAAALKAKMMDLIAQEVKEHDEIETSGTPRELKPQEHEKIHARYQKLIAEL